MTIQLNGKSWYYHLISNSDHPGLFTEEQLRNFPSNLHRLNQPLLISQSYKTNAGKVKPRFALFSNISEFYYYYLDTPLHDHAFFEVVLSHQVQKPRFDIDIPTPDPDIGQRVVGWLISIVMKELSMDPNDILIFDSSSSHKQSYHVVLNKLAHANSGEAKAFYCNIIQQIPKEAAQFIDPSVYSSKQQFRILGSAKLETMRFKRLKESWEYAGYKGNTEKIPNNVYPTLRFPSFWNNTWDLSRFGNQLIESMLTLTSDCKMMKVYESPRPVLKMEVNPDMDITADMAEEALNIYLMSEGIRPDLQPFSIDKILGRLILLKRNMATHCPLCLRDHESENPYLILVTPQGGGNDIVVKYHCRRAYGVPALRIGKMTNQEILDEVVKFSPLTKDELAQLHVSFHNQAMKDVEENKKKKEEEAKREAKDQAKKERKMKRSSEKVILGLCKGVF